MLRSIIVCLLFGSSLIAADNITPTIRSFDIAVLERLGNDMYEQDIRAARATDIIRAEHVRFPDGFLRGWIVSKQGSTQIVRFIGEKDGVLMAAADVTFQDSKKGKLTQFTPIALTGAELNQAKARLLVAKDVEHLPELCSRTYNLIALPDPDGSGFLIWAIAANTNADEVQIGGHYRYTMSDDGSAIESRDRLFKSCFVLSKRPPNLPAGSTLAGLAMGWIVSDTPLEIHVFLERYAGLPFSIATVSNGKIWTVEKGTIKPMN